MKRLLATAMIAMLALTSCAAKDQSADSAASSQSDPIYNDSAAFNDINEPVLNNETASSDKLESFNAAAEQSLADAYKRYSSALSAAEKLNSYRMTSAGAVAVEIEKTSVELEKITAKYSAAISGDFTVESRTDIKDTHNSSVSQLLETVYGNKESGKMHTRSEFASFVSVGDDYLDTRRSAYKRPDFSKAIGAAYGFKPSDVDTVTLTETDGAATVKFMLKADKSVSLVRTELSGAGITAKAADVKAEYFIVTAVIDSQGVLAACSVSARATVAENVYTVSRELSLTDKNSAAFVCVKPAWV